jgi:hypothetical protein
VGHPPPSVLHVRGGGVWSPRNCLSTGSASPFVDTVAYMQPEYFCPARDRADIDFRGSRLGIEMLAVGGSLEITAHPAAVKSAIVRALALHGQFDREYLIERAASYEPSRPAHRITRVK